jgi:hypothetical protein
VHKAPIFVTQQIFQQDAQRKRQPGHIFEAAAFQVFEAMNLKGLRAHVQFVARSKRVCCGNCHLAVFSSVRALMITELTAERSRSRPARSTSRAILFVS